MEGKGKLHKILGIACELLGHAEKGTEDRDQSRASLLEKLEALSCHCNKPSFRSTPVSQLCPCGLPVTPLCCAAWQTAGPLTSWTVRCSSPCLWWHWLLFEIWNKEMYLLVILPSLRFFPTVCFLSFLFYTPHWRPWRRLLWKSSQWVKVVVRTQPQQKWNPSSIAKRSMFCISGKIQIH